MTFGRVEVDTWCGRYAELFEPLRGEQFAVGGHVIGAGPDVERTVGGGEVGDTRFG